MTDGDKTYAVLTGDIAGSSRYDPKELKTVMQNIRKWSEDFSRTCPGLICGKLDVFRGDGWQMLLADWRKAMRVAVFMRAIVKADEKLRPDTRIAIGIGSVDRTTLKLEKISESTGEAFQRSGRALKDIRKPFMMAWAKHDWDQEGAGLSDRFFAGALGLLDEIISRWKPGQAQSVARALVGKQQEQIAKELMISQPVVSKSLNSAGWRGINAFLKEIET